MTSPEPDATLRTRRQAEPYESFEAYEFASRPRPSAATGTRAGGPWYDLVDISHIKWRAPLVPGLSDHLECARGGDREEPNTFWLNEDIYKSI